MLASMPGAHLNHQRLASGDQHTDVSVAVSKPVDEVVCFRDLLLTASKTFRLVVVVLDGVENILAQRGREPGEETSAAATAAAHLERGGCLEPNDGDDIGGGGGGGGLMDAADANITFHGSWLGELISLFGQTNTRYREGGNIRLICSAVATTKGDCAAALGLDPASSQVKLLWMPSQFDPDSRQRLIAHAFMGRNRRRRKRQSLLKGEKDCAEKNSDIEDEETKREVQCLHETISADASPRLISNMMRALEALDGNVPALSTKRDAILKSTSLASLFDNLQNIWSVSVVEGVQPTPSSISSRPRLHGLVFAGAILVACALHAEGLHPSEFVKLVRYVVCKPSPDGSPAVKVSSKPVLRLIISLGFQARIGGRIGGAHADMHQSEREHLEAAAWALPGGKQLKEHLDLWQKQLFLQHADSSSWSDDNKNVSSTASAAAVSMSMAATSPLDNDAGAHQKALMACIGHFFVTRIAEPSRSRSNAGCFYLSAGGHWPLVAKLLSDVPVFRQLWMGGWRSQKRVLHYWVQILQWRAESPLKEHEAVDPVHLYRLSLTVLLEEKGILSPDASGATPVSRASREAATGGTAAEGGSVDAAGNEHLVSFGDHLYCVLDLLALLGSMELDCMKLPDYMFPLIPAKHFEEWHSASYLSMARAEENSSRSLKADMHSRKGLYKLYRRFVWSWFPVLAWVTPALLAKKAKIKEDVNKTAAAVVAAAGAGAAPVSGNTLEESKRNVIGNQDILQGITRTPLSEMGKERARLTDAQMKATLRTESSRLEKAVHSPRTLRDNQAAANQGLLPSHQDAFLEVKQEINGSRGRQRKERVRKPRRQGERLLPPPPPPQKKDGIDCLVDQLFMTNGGIMDEGNIDMHPSSLDLMQGLDTLPSLNDSENSLLLTPMTTPQQRRRQPTGSERSLPSLASKYMMSPAVAKFVDAHLQDLPVTEDQARIAEARAIVAELRRKLDSLTVAIAKKEDILSHVREQAHSRDSIDNKSKHSTDAAVGSISKLKHRLEKTGTISKALTMANVQAKRAMQIHRSYPSRDISHMRRLERQLQKCAERIHEQIEAIDGDTTIAKELRAGNVALREETQKGIDMRLEALSRGRARLEEQREKARLEVIKAQKRSAYRNVVLGLDRKVQERMDGFVKRVRAASLGQIATPASMVEFCMTAHKASRDRLRSQRAQLEANVVEHEQFLRKYAEELEMLKAAAEENEPTLADEVVVIMTAEQRQEHEARLKEAKGTINRLASQLWNHSDESDTDVVETLTCVATELAARLMEIDDLVESAKLDDMPGDLAAIASQQRHVMDSAQSDLNRTTKAAPPTTAKCGEEAVTPVASEPEQVLSEGGEKAANTAQGQESAGPEEQVGNNVSVELATPSPRKLPEGSETDESEFSIDEAASSVTNVVTDVAMADVTKVCEEKTMENDIRQEKKSSFTCGMDETAATSSIIHVSPTERGEVERMVSEETADPEWLKIPRSANLGSAKHRSRDPNPSFEAKKSSSPGPSKNRKNNVKSSRPNDSWFSEISDMMASPEDSDEDLGGTTSSQNDGDAHEVELWESRKNMFIVNENGKDHQVVEPTQKAGIGNSELAGMAQTVTIATAGAPTVKKPAHETHMVKSVFAKPPSRRRGKKSYY
jgi:hypothetical protein